MTLPGAAALLLSLLSGCVKKSEYDALQVENQALQTRLDQANYLVVQSQTDLAAVQVQMQQFPVVQAQLQTTQEELKKSQEEFKSLKTQFDHFRTQRRSAMVGKKYPLLSLEDGKVLHEAEITAVTAEDVSIRHAAGLVKVAFAKTTPDLRWEACYDPQEVREKVPQNLVGKSPDRTPKRFVEQEVPPAAPAVAATPAQKTVDLLRARLASQRQALNADYQSLAAKNPAALRGAEWDSSRPESSALLSTLSGSRAVLGISRLQSQRSAILATLQQLRELDPNAR